MATNMTGLIADISAYDPAPGSGAFSGEWAWLWWIILLVTVTYLLLNNRGGEQ